MDPSPKAPSARRASAARPASDAPAPAHRAAPLNRRKPSSRRVRAAAADSRPFKRQSSGDGVAPQQQKGARLSGVFLPVAAVAQEANRRLNTLIEDNLVEARGEYHAIQSRLAAAHCTFGDSVIRTFLKPDFVTRAEHDYLRHVIPLLLGAVERTLRLYFEAPSLAPFFSLDDSVRRWVEIEPHLERNIVLARLDGFLSSGRLHFLELNVDSPAGMGYTDLLEAELLRTAPLGTLAREYRLQRSHRKKALLEALLAAYRQWGGRKHAPRIAIVDWDEVKTHAEFDLLRAYFERRGYATTVIDPRALTLAKGALTDGRRRIDLIYRRVMTPELARRNTEVGDFYRAARDNRVCVINPFRSRVASSKAIFEMLADPLYDAYFTDAENVVKRRHIPWTQRVALGFTTYQGATHDLVTLLRKQRGAFVLKPDSGYGGADVYIGRETPQETWERVLEAALAAGDWIAQAYVPVPEKTMPVFPASGGLLFQSKKVNLNPFAFGARYAGSFTRVSDSSIVNVTRGGGIIPTIVARPRSPA